jgi:hypothetical protein
MARFETVLDLIERDEYRLRPEYPEAKSARAGAQMGWSIFSSAFSDRQSAAKAGALTVR